VKTLEFDYDPPVLLSDLSLKAYAGLEAAISVEGLAGVSFSPDVYLDLEADSSTTPWWTLTGGLEGPVSLDVTAWGLLSSSYSAGDLFDEQETLAQAPYECSYAFAPANLLAVDDNLPVIKGLGQITASQTTCPWNLVALSETNSHDALTMPSPGSQSGTGNAFVPFEVDFDPQMSTGQFFVVGQNLSPVDATPAGLNIYSFDGGPSTMAIVPAISSASVLCPCSGGAGYGASIAVFPSLLPNVVNGEPYYYQFPSPILVPTDYSTLDNTFTFSSPAEMLPGISLSADGVLSSNGAPVSVPAGIGEAYPRISAFEVIMKDQYGNVGKSYVPFFIFAAD
jgi:hypothetical protein